MSSDGAQQFQVDLRGVVDLLSRHIYSGPRVYLRELLQNARDAIAARREADGGGGGIRITPIREDGDEFVLRDDGIGLTADEVAELLATVGRSSKRDIFDLPREDYLGQFGIGLLSCFMVSDEIVIRSRSARGGDPVLWRGRSDGTFTVEPLAGEVPIGTSVHLRARFDQGELLRTPAVLRLAETFGEFLPVRVSVDLPTGGEQLVTRPAPFLDGAPQERHAFGREMLKAEPFDEIVLDVPATGTRGVAYVLPFSPPPGSRQATRAYLGRMLVSERADELLPEWAFFVRAVIDSTVLSPTASRESFIEDTALELTRQELGAAVRRWVLDLGLTAPHRLAQFVAIHEVALKSLVRHDEELAGFIVRWLSVDTAQGRCTIGRLVDGSGRVAYAETVDEYRQVASIHDPAVPLVNGGYLYDADLIRMLPELYPGLVIERVDAVAALDRLDPPPLAERPEALAIERRAAEALASVDCQVVVRSIDDPDLPAVYVADAAQLRRIDRRRTRGTAGALWGGVLDRLDAASAGPRPADDKGEDTGARLCLNWSSRVVRALTEVDDGTLGRTVQLLYVQALLAGQRPLTERDRTLMTGALDALVTASVVASAHREDRPRPDAAEEPR